MALCLITPSNYDLVVAKLPKVETASYTSTTTDYTLINLDAHITELGIYRITVLHQEQSTRPRGVILSNSNTNYTSTTNVLAKTETTDDVNELSAGVVWQYITGAANGFYIWLKSRDANETTRVALIIEKLS